LELYPKEIKTNFSIEEWKGLCKLYKEKADEYRKTKTTTDSILWVAEQLKGHTCTVSGIYFPR
jgi:hypothetical protein